MSDAPEQSDRFVRTAAPPEVSAQGREVFSFHLHRYLSGWLGQNRCERAMITVGFDASTARLGAYRIDRDGGHSVRSGWTHRDLEDAWRFGDGRLVWEAPSGESIGFDVLGVFDEVDEDTPPRSSDLLGFATVREACQLDEAQLQRLSRQAGEAIRVARRNAVRLFFEEHRDEPVKSLLYRLMDRLPEWTGCDHSASVLLTHDLDAMTLEDSPRGAFEVLAERLFEPEDSTGERLVGMSVETTGASTVIADAFSRHRREEDRQHFLYHRLEDDDGWAFAHGETTDGSQPAVADWYELEGRRRERTVVLVPLTSATRGRGPRELLGFLTLAWRQRVELPESVHQLFDAVGRQLGRLLRQSSLYTLSVRKLWVVRRVRQQVEAAVERGASGREAAEELIGEVSSLVADHVDVPSFAIGYLRDSPSGRTLRYAHPHGWTRYDDLDLQVDVPPEKRVDSGISALAVRLSRPVVLAGGHGEGADQRFKNHLWVDEQQHRLFDARHPELSRDELADGCRPLRDYYKPARESAYASLAYPMVFSDRQLGVLTVEVERSTDWLWWTGFGGHLFWAMVAREVAMGLYLLR